MAKCQRCDKRRGSFLSSENRVCGYCYRELEGHCPTCRKTDETCGAYR